MPAIIGLQTQSAREVVDITARVEALVVGAATGSCHQFLRHTTAALMAFRHASPARTWPRTSSAAWSAPACMSR